MRFRFFVFVLIVIANVLPLAAESGDRSGIYGRLPMRFEQNVGQSDSRVKFFSRGSGYAVFLTPDEVVLSLGSTDPAVFRMTLAGQNSNPRIEGVDPLMSTTNYLLGADAGGWRKDVPSFSKVRYHSVYRGIDVVYYGNGSHLEYDFVVAPQADPNNIQLDYKGVESLSVDKSGDLVLNTGAGEVRQQKPTVYQDIQGKRVFLDGAYVIKGKRRVAFKVGRYDKSKPLIIDPVLVYSSYFGGTAGGTTGDLGIAIAVDAAGNAYVTGHTGSPAFPVTNASQPSLGGGQDAFVLKLNPAGTSVLFSTFIGGSASDEGHSIVLDGQNNIVIAGHTSSPNFPVVNGAQAKIGGNQDAFVLKLNNSGTAILYSTFLGGDLDDRALGVVLDTAGATYVTGMASSRNFPTSNPFQGTNGGGLSDVFVAKLNSNGAIVYSTYVGGIGHDHAYSIAVDGEANAYVVGFTTSVNFPTKAPIIEFFNGGADDAFVFKLNPAGNAMVYSTFFGGGGSEAAVRVAVDSAGSAHVAGLTSSPNFPLKNAIQSLYFENSDAFVVKFTPDASDVVYSTFLGGFGTEGASGIALDAAGNTYVSGFTTSFDFPAVNSVQAFLSSDRDAFVTKLMPDGQKILYSTYLGGFGIDGAVGLTATPSGDVFVTGFTTSGDFPISNAFQAENAGGQDAFIAKIDASDIVRSSPFSMSGSSGASFQTSGKSRDAAFGFAVAEAGANAQPPAGIALIELRQVGALVTSLALPAPALIQSGRFSVDINQQLTQALSFANPTDEEVLVDFYFTDLLGTAGAAAQAQVPPRTQLSRFITDAPYGIGGGAVGTLTFVSSAPIYAAAFRVSLNERNESLLSVAPIIDLARYPSAPPVISQFAEGVGWTTEVVMVNTGDERLTGEIRFIGDGTESEPGKPVAVDIGGTRSSTFEYDIQPGSVFLLKTSSIGQPAEGEFPEGEVPAATLQTGWIRVVPFAGSGIPRVSAITSYVDSALSSTVTQTAFEGQVPSTSFRLYAEASGDFKGSEPLSKQTTVSFANPSAAPVAVRLELVYLDGRSGPAGSVRVPANGHTSLFLNQVPGFENVPLPFRGVLNVTTSSPSGIAGTGGLATWSDRGGFILTTMGPIIEDAGSGSSIVFPHIAEGGGYTTRFILLNRRDRQPASGVLRYFDQEGRPYDLTLQ